ncbi:MAG: hypothetical protein PVF17_00595 [Ignavibacteria bacterium]|jgi:hypothetical protein
MKHDNVISLLRKNYWKLQDIIKQIQEDANLYENKLNRIREELDQYRNESANILDAIACLEDEDE